ncbi:MULTISPECIES: pentapeptide repeat-containing protein [Thalassospira]|uniref:Pentapeptide repeat-containing protein n=1 Tax=Thalassospira aquimaris TaxID=3037796 RepID=A0ABT6G6I3_9PROT|nr:MULTISPECIES: pentapeptide repeat-containing protein [Thalassospira]MDG4717656.1 pentapeptide repeat-containing protein [Thalassospira sp. FZY0004]
MAIKDNKNKTILYADYSERNILAAKTAVEPLGFGNFVSCDDREKTIELVRELCPDMVLIGLYLDGMRGISTIRAIRETATDDNLHGRTVPVLLGAPKLDRRGMRDAVEAGIEGIFRQPVDPQRLCKIIETVMKAPRRFVLKDNYFGPARPEDLANAGVTVSGKAYTTPPEEQENPGRRKRDRIKAAMEEMPPVSVPGKRVATSFKSPVAPTAPASKPVKSEPIETAAQPEQAKSPITGIAGNLDIADLKSRLNGAGQIFDDGDLRRTSSVSDKHAQAQNIKAVQSVRDLLSPTQETPAEDPADLVEDEPLDTASDDDTEELVEIDLNEALIMHKLWVDTGGKEGNVMSIEHADLREAELEGIDLSRCGLPFACFKRANCKQAVLRRCDLTGADFIESNLDSANLAASRLSGARFNDAMLRNTVFLGSDLSNASFRGQQLLNCDLSGTNLAGTDFRDADLSGTRGLFAEQIQRARVNANTRLPRNLKLRD